MTDPAWETVIGLETHAQLASRAKLFCACPADNFGKEPNTAICPICAGHPGTLPVLNRGAAELAFTAALALGCELRARSVFARKNYFYPDLPKGYQISQYEEPLASGGAVPLGAGRAIPLVRAHLEEDAGKLLHALGAERLPHTLVDLNRAGTPLVEIVSQPELRSPEEAFAYLTSLKSILRYCGASRCDMEKGELRCDANISLRRPGGPLGTRVEIKNLNSFKAVRDALAYEARRQRELLESGGTVVQETRLWDGDAGRTEPMRGKEEAHDYRYFPDPDLPPLAPEPAWLERLRAALPELPAARKARFMAALGLSEYDAGVLTAERPLADYFEAVLAAGAEPKAAANWVSGELLARLNAAGLSVARAPVPAPALAGLLSLVSSGKVSGSAAKEAFARMWESGEGAEAAVRALGLEQVSDEGALGAWIDACIDENPQAAAEFRAGKEKAAGRIVGCVMKRSGGKANPALVNKLIKERLS